MIIRIWGRVSFEGACKKEQVQFVESQFFFFFSNLNTINIKLFHGGTYRFQKFKKCTGEINPLGIHRNMRECILKFKSKGLLW